MNTKKKTALSNRLTRRGLLAGAAGAVAAVAGVPGIGRAKDEEPASRKSAVTKGRINQSVCDWCFLGDCSSKPMTLDELCRHAAAMGIKSV